MRLPTNSFSFIFKSKQSKKKKSPILWIVTDFYPEEELFSSPLVDFVLVVAGEDTPEAELCRQADLREDNVM